MDSFFAEVEIRENPQLRRRPVIVGGREGRGVVCSATYDARARGVHAAMPVAQARRLCPEATVVPVQHDLYARVGGQVRDIFRRYTPIVEPLSIDEAFLDVSSVRKLYGTPREIASQIRTVIRTELRLPASIGVAATKLVAKTASAHAKPDGMLLIPADRSVEFMHALPVGALWGVGKKTRERLEFGGIRTIAELAQMPVEVLRGWFGDNSAQRLHDLAWAIDPRAVEVKRIDKSIGKETTFAVNVTDREQVIATILRQSHQVAARLREKEKLAYTVGIKVRAGDFTTVTRAHTLQVPTDLARVIAPTAQALFAKLKLPRGGIRLIGVRTTNLVAATQGVQTSLTDNPKDRISEQAIDKVRARYGRDLLTPASLLEHRENYDDQAI